MVKPLYEQSPQAGYESMDNHDEHDTAIDSSDLLYFLLKSKVFEITLRKMDADDSRTTVLYPRHGVHRYHQLERSY